MPGILILLVTLASFVFSDPISNQLNQIAKDPDIVSNGGAEVMMISPQVRAQDFKEAFDYLKKIQNQSKITFTLKDNSKLTQILEVNILPGGTMLSFKISTIQGVQYHIIRIEDIKTITLQ